jgi:RimJ/RimL family protein N-acetyltransferase
MEALETADLVLEPLTVAHAEAMFPILSDPILYRYLDYGPPPSVNHVRGVYEQLQKRASPDGHETWLNWVICLRGTLPIGYVQATLVPTNSAWVAYFLGSAYWGHGYAYAATETMLRHLAEIFGSKLFLATVEIANVRSIALLKRLSFEQVSGQDAASYDLSNTELLFKRHTALVDESL